MAAPTQSRSCLQEVRGSNKPEQTSFQMKSNYYMGVCGGGWPSTKTATQSARLVDWLIDWFKSVSARWRLNGRSVTGTPTNGHRFTALGLPWRSPIPVLTGLDVTWLVRPSHRASTGRHRGPLVWCGHVWPVHVICALALGIDQVL